MSTIGKPLDTFAAAAMLGISPSTARIWRVRGYGPKFHKLGPAKQSPVIYLESDIVEWLETRKVASTSAYSPNGIAADKANNRCASEVTA